VHILVPRDRIDAQSGIIARTEKSVLFVIPWDNHWLIGTTDTEWELDLEQPTATSTDIDYILDHVNQLVTNKLTRADIVGVFAGLRPLISGSASSTTKLSREHAVISPAPGFTVIAGGKYTTYRVMAKDAVDAALASGRGMQPRSISSRVRLLGADGFQELWESRESLAAAHNLSTAQIEHLLRRFGTVVLEVLATIQAEPELREPLSGAPMYLKAEITYAVTHEGAIHLEDVLMRRTRISIDTSDRGVIAAREVAELMSQVLHWSDAERESEIARYIETIAAERRAQQQLTDEAALRA
jgi:glycerol-3-phosphate dehydrogenase